MTRLALPPVDIENRDKVPLVPDLPLSVRHGSRDDAGVEPREFRPHADTIARAILDSTTPLTIGLFGPWGSGKTTLMRMVERRLDSQLVPTVWFEAWRFEAEPHLILPLLQTVRLSLAETAGFGAVLADAIGAVLKASVALGISAVLPPPAAKLDPVGAVKAAIRLRSETNGTGAFISMRWRLFVMSPSVRGTPTLDAEWSSS